ncbi:ion channel [Anaerovorax odorimutans]|uniref:ion channel n=1 Tax=Anaerovorax odorimutans TaxID=109327 RepID=UPI00048371AF|nr:ion channel [Anaerovorax odorimutans]
MFSSKEFNHKFSNSKSFFPKEPPTRITKIAPHTYYEGIEFNNILFESFKLEQICFHNCSFRNCSFKNIRFKKDFVGFAPNYIQGFSSCDFFNVNFENCDINNTFFSIGNLNHIHFINTNLCNSLFHRISFNKVVFSGISTLNNTSFYFPSKSFDVSFIGAVEQFHVDAKCVVTAFSYDDKTNITLEEWFKYKIWKSVKHKEVANTLFTFEQIWTANHIREEHNNYANFYYQRKKAETRSLAKWSRFTGYISEFTIGYGKKPFRAFGSLGVLILIFSLIYLFTGFSPTTDSPEIRYYITGCFDSLTTLFTDYLQSLYYSFFTMISVGQGSASPSTPLTQIAMSVELLLGAILVTLFTGTLFRKYTK